MAYDRLFYELRETNGRRVLINKLNIKDRDILESTEKMFSISSMKQMIAQQHFDVFDLKTLMTINKKLFGKLYNWAGTARLDNIEKSERVLNGESVDYSNVLGLQDDWNVVQRKLDFTNWSSLNLNDKANRLAEITAGVWKIHYFNEGNTRTTSVFMDLYSKKRNIKVDFNYFSLLPHEFRDNLVLYCDGQKNHLEVMFLKSMMNAEKGNFTSFNGEKTPGLSEEDVVKFVNKFHEGKIDASDMKDIKFDYKDQQFRIVEFDPKVTILAKADSQYAYMAKDFGNGKFRVLTSF